MIIWNYLYENTKHKIWIRIELDIIEAAYENLSILSIAKVDQIVVGIPAFLWILPAILYIALCSYPS